MRHLSACRDSFLVTCAPVSALLILTGGLPMFEVLGSTSNILAEAMASFMRSFIALLPFDVLN
jgi:hypothetical protein